MKNKIKMPVTDQIANVPVVMQLEALECGAASLTMILAYYEKWIPLEQIRRDCGVSRDGSNAKNILKAARSYGLTAKACKCEPSALKAQGKFPCIIHWNFNHFVVLKGFKKNKVYINDPGRGDVIVTAEEFDESFTGVCLMFEPGENFEPSGKPKSILKFAMDRLRGSKTAIIFVVLTTIIASLIGIVNTAFSRVFIDRILSGKNYNWFIPFIAAISGLAIIQIITSFINVIYLKKINGKMAVIGTSSFMWKVLRLPMEFFSQRMAGDIQMRQISNSTIASDLINTFAPLVLNTAMMIFYLVVMLRYNIVLTLIGIISIVLNLIISNIISKKRINITRVKQRDEGKLAGTEVAGIEMIETIKSSGAENGFFEKWAGYQASVIAQNTKFSMIERRIGVLPTIVSELTSVLILILGTYYSMHGNFTIGMIMAFQGFLSSFTTPAMMLISAGQTMQEMRTDMERVDDVMKYPCDIEFCNETNDENAEYDKLSGNVEIKNITFGYSRLAAPLIKDFSLSLKQGQRIAFVGTSGCGKSTLSKLISGLYKPWNGEILFDGKPMSEIDRNVFTGSLAVVDQDIIVFEDTIANNIRMWDDSIEDFEIIMAARDAQIHEDIMQREGGYECMMTEGGRDFSGGQRQRMEIARVLAQDPTIIILDEATSALDAKTEFDVVKSIKDRGITCIVVAHRLSTIRDCDEIIVMDKGVVVERGTHEELYAKNGYYTQLVSNE